MRANRSHFYISLGGKIEEILEGDGVDSYSVYRDNWVIRQFYKKLQVSHLSLEVK